MNELAQLVQEWLVAEDVKVEWWVTNYSDLADLLLYGSKPVNYVSIIFEDNILCNEYVWPYKIIADSKKSIYATDPEFFKKLRSMMNEVEEAVKPNDTRP